MKMSPPWSRRLPTQPAKRTTRPASASRNVPHASERHNSSIHSSLQPLDNPCERYFRLLSRSHFSDRSPARSQLVIAQNHDVLRARSLGRAHLGLERPVFVIELRSKPCLAHGQGNLQSTAACSVTERSDIHLRSPAVAAEGVPGFQA